MNDGGPYYVAVGNWDYVPSPERDFGTPEGPIVFEQYLADCTLEAARGRMRIIDVANGGGRIARLDFDLGGSPDDAYVIVANSDGVDRGPLVWETYIDKGRATRAKANANAARLERSYGACRIARLVFDDTPPNDRSSKP